MLKPPIIQFFAIAIAFLPIIWIRCVLNAKWLTPKTT